ncbi:MAG: alpha/beta hydrolase [Candidatus Heimdallarchaeota archaeon]
MISIDRPGCGLSTYQERRKISDWSFDINELAEELSLDKFSILGFSTGGVYALDYALHYPERIVKLGLVSSIPYFVIDYSQSSYPFQLRMIKGSSRFPLLGRTISHILSSAGINNYRRNPEKEYEKSLKALPDVDRETWLDPSIKEWFLGDYIPDLIQPNLRGYSYDLFLMLKSLTNPEKLSHKIGVEYPVYFWHGENDNIVPPISSIEQQKLILNSELILYPLEGHKVIYTHFNEIISKLIA